jgi:hypothetical protein
MPACRECGVQIGFTETEHGRLMPTNADGTSHFGSCSVRLAKRKTAPPDNICAACGSDHVEREPGKGPHYGALRCLDCRAFRWLRRPVESQA